MNELVISFIRSVVPMIVGFIVTYLAAKGITLDQQFLGNLSGALTVLFGAVYYIGARIFEKYLSPKFGWLLGYAKMPQYVVKPKLPSDL